ncbi:MAG: septal ring lytic transglycosylase RlpA family protein [Tannerellaceae bacterium]|nr:septal ring lytic transglycosylase RlpA family protein [Tannerellaceae bacterium]
MKSALSIYLFLLPLLLFSRETYAQEEGIASYYHKRFQGRRTSNGDLYDYAAYTAAHREYPFGTYVRVTNLRNEKSVIVCVTDRGPRHRNRLIDLSYAAAEELDFIKRGITRVKLEIVPFPFELRYLDLLSTPLPFSVCTSRLQPPLKFNEGE